MCFIGIKPQGNISNIAEEPIEVYKVLRKSEDRVLYAPIMTFFQYEIGKEYETTLDVKDYDENYNIIINSGFHSFSKECFFTLRHSGEQCVMVKAPNANTPLLDLPYSDRKNIAVVKCIIPKWSQYFENHRGEIVSSRLQVVSELEGEWEMAKFKDINV